MSVVICYSFVYEEAHREENKNGLVNLRGFQVLISVMLLYCTSLK